MTVDFRIILPFRILSANFNMLKESTVLYYILRVLFLQHVTETSRQPRFEFNAFCASSSSS